MKPIKKLEKGCKELYEWGYDVFHCGNTEEKPDDRPDFLCLYCRLRIQTLKEVLELIEDVDLELIFTDIKDRQGNKIPESNELMELFRVFWEYASKQLKSKIEGK